MAPLAALDGTLVNVATVVVGSALGLAVRGRLPERITAVLLQAIGLTTLYIGFTNAGDLARVGDPPGVILGLVALALGAALGEWARLGDRLEGLGHFLKRRLRGRGRFTEGFVAASLLFCVGPMTLVGSLQNGLTGDASLLLLKAALDGISAVALAATFGFGVLASALVVLVLPGGLALGAGAVAAWLPDPAVDPRVLLVNGVGGLMIVGLGLMLLEVRRVSVAAMLPALPLVVVLYEVAARLR
jgi:uncharacterized membrane protein YqgA involved in biofilm formation